MKEKKPKLSAAEKKMLKQQQKQLQKMEKMQKKQKEEYVPLRGIMGNATDYNVYNLSLTERLLGFLIGFAGGFAVMYIFFRVAVMSLVLGLFTGILAQKPFQNMLLQKRKRTLLLQFKDLLEALAASYSAGLNTRAAFEDAYQDLANVYGVKADITQELQIILVGMSNNFIIEDLLFDFAKRSGLEDIENFANVFAVSNRQGANIRKVVSDSRDIISDKIEIEMEINTLLSGNKNQLNIMIVMPLVIMLSLSSMGTMSAVTNNFVNVVVKIGVLILFAIAYMMGRKIVDIKI